jgi:hypothetical protein
MTAVVWIFAVSRPSRKRPAATIALAAAAAHHGTINAIRIS